MHMDLPFPRDKSIPLFSILSIKLRAHFLLNTGNSVNSPTSKPTGSRLGSKSQTPARLSKPSTSVTPTLGRGLCLPGRQHTLYVAWTQQAGLPFPGHSPSVMKRHCLILRSWTQHIVRHEQFK